MIIDHTTIDFIFIHLLYESYNIQIILSANLAKNILGSAWELALSLTRAEFNLMWLGLTPTAEIVHNNLITVLVMTSPLEAGSEHASCILTLTVFQVNPLCVLATLLAIIATQSIQGASLNKELSEGSTTDLLCSMCSSLVERHFSDCLAEKPADSQCLETYAAKRNSCASACPNLRKRTVSYSVCITLCDVPAYQAMSDCVDQGGTKASCTPASKAARSQCEDKCTQK